MSNQFWVVLLCFICSAGFIAIISVLAGDLNKNGETFIVAVILLVAIWVLLAFIIYSTTPIATSTVVWL